MVRAPDDAGPSICSLSRQSVVRAERTGVKPPDQFAADGLHGLLRMDPGGPHDASNEEGKIVGFIAGVAILGLPVQTGKPAESVFITSADKPTAIGMGRDAQIVREEGGVHAEEGDGVEARLCIAR